MSTPACSAPLELGELLAYQLGELCDADEDRVEEHYFECARCSERLAGLSALGDALI